MSEPDEQQRELRELRWDWSDAYSITADGDEFTATRRDHPSKMLRAGTVAELREAIVADYAKKSAPRETGNHEAGDQ